MHFCIIDTETTGLDSEYHEIIQIAVIVCDSSLNEVARTSFKIRPNKIERASKQALKINGYHPRTWNPQFYSHKKALKYLNSFVEKHTALSSEVVVAGQNIKFDVGFLLSAYEDEGIFYPFSYTTLDLIDVVKIWEKINKTRLKSRSLSYLSKFTGCVNDNPHDAEADAEVTLDIFKWFIEDLKKEKINERKGIRKRTKIKI